ncbi:MAG: FadR family transcriptional regulator [Clostridiales bacterium]|jgi:GntR family transcriptional repressor for pyruvate dehydrogenase complex|nr:FadR family transcriptional regulator [Clostridiales bacterium]
MVIDPIKRISPSEQVFEQIRKMILHDEWKPGERIPPESELASLFDVSRATVRQALLRLSTMGLVETRWGEGNFVKEVDIGSCANTLLPAIYLSDDAIRHVWEFRLITEVESAGLAAQRAKPKDLKLLRANLERMTALQGDVDSCLTVDFEFHRIVTRMTGNPILIQTQTIMKDVLFESISTLTKAVGANDGLSFHRKICLALEKGDAQLAREMMREHLESAFSLYDRNAPLDKADH